MNKKPLGISLVVLAVILFAVIVRVRDTFREADLRFDYYPGPIGFLFGIAVPVVLCGLGFSLMLTGRKGGGRDSEVG